ALTLTPSLASSEMAVVLPVVRLDARESTHGAQQARVVEIGAAPAPYGEDAAERTTPGARPAVVHGRETTPEHELELLHATSQLRSEPWHVRMLVRHPPEPLRRTGLFRYWRTYLSAQVSIVAVPGSMGL